MLEWIAFNSIASASAGAFYLFLLSLLIPAVRARAGEMLSLPYPSTKQEIAALDVYRGGGRIPRHDGAYLGFLATDFQCDPAAVVALPPGRRQQGGADLRHVERVPDFSRRKEHPVGRRPQPLCTTTISSDLSALSVYLVAGLWR